MLTNPRADRVRRVAGLSGRSARVKQGQYLIEGPQAVREAVRHSSSSIRDLYLTEDAAARYPEILQSAQDAEIYHHLTAPEVLQVMSGDAQGLLAVASMAPPVGLEALASLRDERGPRLVAVCAEVTDPGNAGTIIRTADAAGADAVVFCAGSVEVTNPKVVRSSAGSLFHLPVITGVSVAEVAQALGALDVQLLAADGAGSLDLDDLLDAGEPASATPLAGAVADDALAMEPTAASLAAPTAWLFGHEARGLSAEQLAEATAAVRIPIHGQAESLNLATAAALCLYASARAQR